MSKVIAVNEQVLGADGKRTNVLMANVTIKNYTPESSVAEHGQQVLNDLVADKVETWIKQRCANAVKIARANDADSKHADYGKPVDAQAIAQRIADEFTPIPQRGEGDGAKRNLNTVASALAKFQAGEIDIAEFTAACQAATEATVKATA